MTGPTDPGDPYQPGTLRYRARTELLACVAVVLDGSSSTPPIAPKARWSALREAYRVWILYGRDGE